MTSRPILAQFPPIPGVASGSPFCLKVHAALRLKGVDYEVRNLMTPGQLRRVSPTGKLPVLCVDGRTLADSTAILAWLDERHPKPPLLPTDEPARTQALLLEDWADESLYFSQLWHRWASPTGRGRMPSIILGAVPALVRPLIARSVTKQIDRILHAQGLGRRGEAEIRAHFQQQWDWLETLLGERAYLLGDVPTVADLSAGAMLAGIIDPWLPEEHAQLAARPRLGPWLGRLAPLFAHPAPGAA